MNKINDEQPFSFALTLLTLLLGIATIVYSSLCDESSDNLINNILKIALVLSIANPIITCVGYAIFKRFFDDSIIARYGFNMACIVVFIVQVIVFAASIFLYSCYIDEVYTTKASYRKIIEEAKIPQECLLQFPGTIPKEAKNVRVEYAYNSFVHKNFILSFDIDKEYIKNEIKKYDYVEIDEPGNYLYNYKLYSNKKERTIANDGYTFYLLKGKAGVSYDMSIHCGIGANEEEGKIIYYYNAPPLY